MRLVRFSVSNREISQTWENHVSTNGLKNLRSADETRWKINKKKINLTFQFSFSLKKFGRISTHRRVFSKCFFQLEKNLWRLIDGPRQSTNLPNALDKVAAKIPAKRKIEFLLCRKKILSRRTDDDRTVRGNHSHCLIIVNQTRFAVSFVEIHRTINDFDRISVSTFVKIN